MTESNSQQTNTQTTATLDLPADDAPQDTDLDEEQVTKSDDKHPQSPESIRKTKPVRKIAGYNNRAELARRMRLDPKDNIAIRERREFIKIQSIGRGYTLDKAFEDFDNDTMYRLVKSITVDMQTQYGSWWSGELTRDIIHAICLDKVRNTNVRARGRGRGKETKKETTRETTNETKPRDHASVASKGNTLRPAAATNKKHGRNLVGSSDESDVAVHSSVKKRAVGTTPKKPPPTLLYQTPSTKPTACNPKTQSQSQGEVGLSSLGSHANYSPSVPYPDMSPSFHSQKSFPEDTFPPDSPTLSRVNQPSKQPSKLQPDTQSLKVFVAGHKPFFITHDTSISGFDQLIRRFLNWNEDEFLLYRAAIGLPRKNLQWKAMANPNHFDKFKKMFRETGMLVKVVEPSWFDEDVEEPVCI